jgi:hypothetical protein
MKKRNLYLLGIILLTFSSVFNQCNSNYDYSDSDAHHRYELNDYTHLDNEVIEMEKRAVLNTLIKFDDWYLNVFNNLRYKDYWRMYHAGRGTLTDSQRIGYIQSKILPAIDSCNLLTPGLKAKAHANFNELKDPGNLAILLSGNWSGRILDGIVCLNKSYQRYYFHRHFLDTYFNPDEDNPPGISYEEAEYYHLSMIKLLDKNHAMFKISYDLLSPDAHTKALYVLCYLQKSESGNWQIDDFEILDYDKAAEDSLYNKKIIPFNRPIDTATFMPG